VHGPDEPAFDGECTLLFDDLKLGPDGDVAPFGDEHEHHAGREGEVLLVNGEQQPELRMAAGTIERWRIVDAANTRYVRLAVGGRPFKIIRSDGGLLPGPIAAEEVLVTPGERVDLAVGPFEEGEVIEALPYDRGKGETDRATFATLRVGPVEPSHADVPEALRRIDPLVPVDAEPTRVIDLKALMHAGHGQRAEPVRVGELQVWDLVNETGQDHPFHIHGFFFQVLRQKAGAVARCRLEGHRERSAQEPDADRVAPRRPARGVDVPLPHPRAPRDGHDGPLRGRSLS
jgi:FtsP/CotA-like multicopper oxidase with cupredoxin domain